MNDTPIDDGWHIPDERWAAIAPLLPKRSYPTGGARGC